MPDELTPPQQRIVDELRAAARERRPPPSTDELRRALGFSSPRAVAYHVERLEAAGVVRRRPGHRGLELVGEPRGFTLPIVGPVAAGKPLAVSGHGDERFEFEKVFGSDGVVLMRVRGDSMLDRHICPGDLVAVRPHPEAVHGQTVVVSIDGEVALKVFRSVRGVKWLFPCGEGHQPIRLTPDRENVVLGVLVGVIRHESLPKQRARGD